VGDKNGIWALPYSSRQEDEEDGAVFAVLTELAVVGVYAVAPHRVHCDPAVAKYMRAITYR